MRRRARKGTRMKAFLAFAIEFACFCGIIYFYIQNRKKEKAKKEAEEQKQALEDLKDKYDG